MKTLPRRRENWIHHQQRLISSKEDLNPVSVYCTRAVHKETELFFSLLLYLQLNQTCLLKILPSTLDTPRSMFFFSSSGTCPGTLHNATIASVLRALAGSLFQKFGFFMDCLRTVSTINTFPRTKSAFNRKTNQ